MDLIVNGWLNNRKFAIEVLILDSNYLTDKHIFALSDALLQTGNQTLKILSLAQNQITDVGLAGLTELIDMSNTKVRELRLNWNKITAKGGLMLAQALHNNKHIKSLNLGWNNIGVVTKKMEKSQIGRGWGQALTENTSLLHLDLSFNKIDQYETQILSEKLKKNHTLLGIHYQGNEGRIDSLGFLNVKESPTTADNALE